MKHQLLSQQDFVPLGNVLAEIKRLKLSDAVQRQIDGALAQVRKVKPQKPIEALLLSRKDAAVMLGGVSVATIKRLEQAGRLHARRLSRSPSGQVYYAIEEIIALARGEEVDDAA